MAAYAPAILAGARDRFDKPIGFVCQAGDKATHKLPMYCYNEQIANNSEYALALLRDQPRPPARPAGAPVSYANIERLMCALAALTILGDQTRAALLRDPNNCPMSIRRFRNLGHGEQLKFINEIWNATAAPREFHQLGSQMSEPDYDRVRLRYCNGEPLPSSVRPIPGTMGASFDKRLGGRPFVDFGVGFRVEGGANDVRRITTNGMTQQRLNPYLMLKKGYRLDGTEMMDTNYVRIWKQNVDSFNETGVCVSRNFFGATAFPERNSIGEFYLWAVNCGGLRGCDVEDYQLRIGAGAPRNWRPGEKAFHDIPSSCVLGYVPIEKLGALPAGGWRFRISAMAHWTITGAPTNAQRQYIQGELNAWKQGLIDIPAEFDFA